MRVPARLRESAAFLLLGALIVCVASAGVVTALVVGGVAGVPVGAAAAAATAQALRRPVGRVLAALVGA